jgi:transcriptional regulator with XRE-family HTH domain
MEDPLTLSSFDAVGAAGGKGLGEVMHSFVRERRMRLAPDSRLLGEFPRLPIRVGKRVTQEEIAEHLGVSRGWYARFEGGAPAGFSISLLNRLADLLLLGAPERAELMRLAVPGLAPIVLPDSTDLYKALGVVRRAVKRLWRATSEGEILDVAGEEARQLLPHPELIWVRQGELAVRDEVVFPKPGLESAVRLARARDESLGLYTRDQFARLAALLQRTRVGEILSFEVFPRDIVRVVEDALREHGLAGKPMSLAVAPIRGSNGFRAGLSCSSTRPQDVTKLDRAMQSAIAEFASLALK